MDDSRLHSGRFKGAAFLLDSSSISGGRKDVAHRFVNSDTQVIEDLGALPRTITLRCIIASKDYEQSRGALLSAVESGEPGVLIHPLYGLIPDMVARTYTLEESLDDLGRGTITIVFDRSSEAETGVPVPSETGESNILAGAQACLAASSADFVARFNASRPSEVAAAVAKVRSVVSSVRSRLGAVRLAADKLDQINAQLTGLSADVASLVRSPQALADSMYGLFSSLGNAYATAQATVDALVGLFGFGGEDPRPETTVSRIVRNENDDLIDSVVNLASLAYVYSSVPGLAFSATDEIDTLSLRLNGQAEALLNPQPVEVETQDGTLTPRKNKGAVPREELTQLMVSVQEYLDAAKAGSSAVISVHVQRASARLIAYQYYADSGQGEDVLRLNRDTITNASHVSGSVRVVTSDD